MGSLASDPQMLISQLESLGKGIEMKSFNTTRQKTLLNLPIINISTVGGDRPTDQISESTTQIIHSTFNDILAQKPSSGTSTLELAADHEPQSSVSTPPQRQILSTNPLVQPTDEAQFDFNFDNSALDPVHERNLVEQTHSRILGLQKCLEQAQALLKEQQQKVHDLQEDIHFNQLLLGSVPVPVGTEIRTVFDLETSSLSHIDDDTNADSPGAMTLVESVPDPTFTSQTSHLPLKQPVYDESMILDFHDYQALDNIQMEDSMLEPGFRSDSQSPTGATKRKPFPLFSTAKKARTGSNRSYHNPQAALYASKSTNLLNTDSSREGIGDKATASVRPEDASIPVPTARPTSWPRSRIFRRSAGVSVKKITEIFEKLRLPQDNSLSAAA
ncbi:MAG: hypothetical protein Q9213_001184 [Squamulea squamosa]